MQLTDDWSIKFDANNAILVFKELRKNKKGEMVETEDEFYYPNTKTALLGFMHKNIDGAETVEDLIGRIEKVETIINKIK